MPDPGHLLLLEDDEGNALTLSALLEDDGFVVDVCATCSEARRLLASAGPYVAVLLDRGLPDGDGAAVAEDCRALQPRARVVVLSGAEGKANVHVDAYVTKGSGLDAVLRAVTPPSPD